MADSPSRPSLARIAWVGAALLGIGCGVATVLGFFGSVWWRLDLLAHFRVQYAVLLAAVALVCGLMRRWLAVTVAVVFFGVNLAVIAPLYLGSPDAAATGGPELDIALFNVHHDNTAHEAVGRYLRDLDVDVIVALEVTPTWAKALQAALPGYHMVGEWRDDAFGIAVLSRQPLTHHAVLYLADSSMPAVEAILEYGTMHIAVLGIHPPPPVHRGLASERDAIIAAAATWARDAASGMGHQPVDHVVVIGDMNATPWSHPMRQFAADSGLIDSSTGFGVQASWPAQLWPLRIPIDHVLHSPSLTTVRRSVGPFLGSDHRPVRVTLAPAASD